MRGSGIRIGGAIAEPQPSAPKLTSEALKPGRHMDRLRSSRCLVSLGSLQVVFK